MQIECPSCHTQILSDDMNLNNMVAKCRQCHALVSLNRFVSTAKSNADLPQRIERPQVPLPTGFQVEDAGFGLTISRRWFSCVILFLVFFCIAWNSFLVFWYSMAFGNDFPWFFKVFPIAHVAVGIGLTYFTLAGLFNRTTIRVDDQYLKVRHGPIPWLGNQTLPSNEIDQLYTQEQTHHGKHGVYRSYKVCALTRDGRKVVLISNLQEVDQALFIEQRIEKQLGIEDRPMPGEVVR